MTGTCNTLGRKVGTFLPALPEVRRSYPENLSKRASTCVYIYKKYNFRTPYKTRERVGRGRNFLPSYRDHCAPYARPYAREARNRTKEG